ncbi:MAG: hypothetical protein PF445_08920 [Melioribacteraceae bacterium]|jgi:DNA-binding MltR family transcriptional regulator|nr:hypothetical protein [Melioribacteraceae bacterium]
MKKLFKNYTYDFDKNEAKILTSFCKQAIEQMSSNQDFYKDVKAFESIREKIANDPFEVKMTKDENTRLVHQLKENRKHIKATMEKSGFLKKWFYKSMFKQYDNLLETHFSN